MVAPPTFRLLATNLLRRPHLLSSSPTHAQSATSPSATIKHSALGGHKRCLYDGGSAAGCSNSGVTLTKGGEAVGPVRMKFDLSLSVLPEMRPFFGGE
ncbi:hypothetical protein MRB53_021630 [Persea americana]|uniref:Uncharacterized protein n=1 Tax=Persea americana TaxID=3435 RepID=A0ACC2L4P5_PERAE|nr:hypothetical protein MRB53_021630 [Persea americana]